MKRKRRGSAEQGAVVGVGQLERLALAYQKTSKTLQKLARSLRKVLDGAQVQAAAPEAPKARQTPGKGIPVKARKRKGMSAATREKLRQAAKERWAAKKAGEPQGNVGKAGKKAPPASAA